MEVWIFISPSQSVGLVNRQRSTRRSGPAPTLSLPETAHHAPPYHTAPPASPSRPRRRGRAFEPENGPLDRFHPTDAGSVLTHDEYGHSPGCPPVGCAFMAHRSPAQRPPTAPKQIMIGAPIPVRHECAPYVAAMAHPIGRGGNSNTASPRVGRRTHASPG
jgi:hypothetical protein